MSRSLPFAKMHGAGNDYVVLDGIRERLPELGPLARRLSDRHFGVGFDQMLVLRPASREDADFRMEIRNADGSEAEMCANGIRAFLKFLRDRGHTNKESVRVETGAGVVVPRFAGPDRVTVDMGPPRLAPAEIPTSLGQGEGPVVDAKLEVEGEGHTVTCVSMGNPHCVLVVPDVEQAPVTTLGPRIETHPAFPRRTNVEFVQILARDRLRQRTWERGTGETLACGSGACAVAVAQILRGACDRTVAIELRGGVLDIEWPSPEAHVQMTGPAAHVFDGTIPLDEP